jgi:hypothetical protein
MFKDKRKEYSSPEVRFVEIPLEGVLCSSQSVDVSLGGWKEDPWENDGDAY